MAERDELIRQMKKAAEAQGFELLVGEYRYRDGSSNTFYMEPRDAPRISRILARLLNPKERDW